MNKRLTNNRIRAHSEGENTNIKIEGVEVDNNSSVVRVQIVGWPHWGRNIYLGGGTPGLLYGTYSWSWGRIYYIVKVPYFIPLAYDSKFKMFIQNGKV